MPCHAAAAAKSLQSCLTLCDTIDGSPPGSPAPGILQARVLEWGAIAFSKELLTNPKNIPWVSMVLKNNSEIPARFNSNFYQTFTEDIISVLHTLILKFIPGG